jgi:hypothetical protein
MAGEKGRCRHGDSPSSSHRRSTPGEDAAVGKVMAVVCTGRAAALPDAGALPLPSPEGGEGEGAGVSAALAKGWVLILDTHTKEFKRNNPQAYGYR